jgi:hypothetical protein
MKLKKPYDQYEGKLFKFGNGEICLLKRFLEYDISADGPGVRYEHYSFGYPQYNHWYKSIDIFATEFESEEVDRSDRLKIIRTTFEKRLEVI